MKSSLLPTTTLGKWSMGLGISLILFFILSFAIVILGHQTGGETFLDNLYIAVPMFLAGISGIAALIAGIIGILRYKERSALVFLSAAVGLFVLFLVFGEFLAPH
jgi:nitrate reductase gamma subunit